MLPGKKYTPDDFIAILRRHVWLLVVPPVITLFAALLYSSTIPSRYQSEMQIAMVQQQVPDALVRSTVTMTPEEQVDAISLQIRSRVLLAQLIEELNLYPDLRETVPMDELVRIMNTGINIEMQPRRGPRGFEPPNAFYVRFTYTDPEVAARVTQRIGSLFVNRNTRDRGALAAATNQFLETQLVKVREELEAQERRMEAFRQRNGQNLPTQMPTNLQAIQNTQLQIQAHVESMARDRDRKLMLERLYNEAQREPLPVQQQALGQIEQGNASLPVGAAIEQLATARANLAALERRLEPVHPDVTRAKRMVAELEVKAAAEAAAESSSEAPVTPAESARRERLRVMSAEIESLDRQIAFKESEETRLRDVTAQYQRRIEAVPGIESEFSVLNRDYETLQTAYRELLNKTEAAKLSIDLEERQMGAQFRVLDNARIPVGSIGPVRFQITAVGLVAGLLIGLAIAGFLEFRDQSFRSESDVFETLALPVLTIVPHVDTARARLLRSRRRMAFAVVALVATVGAGYVFWARQLWNNLV